MASTVLTGVAPKLPIGTSVGAYPAKNRGVEDSPPTATASATATVATDGSLTFTGLTEGAEYVAAASVSGKWQKTQFWGAWDPTSPAGVLSGDFGTSEAELLAALAAQQVLVSALPSSPSDGQVVNYLADGTNGIVWRLRYRAASGSAYKWEYVGGGFLRVGFTAESKTAAAPVTS